MLSLRLLLMKTAFTALLAALALLLVYGVFVEPRLLLDTEAFEAEVPNLPDAWDGQTVALLADFQVGMWLENDGMVEEALEEALDADPALLLIAGDFLYKPDSARADRAIAMLQPALDAGVPVVAVLGNHDYSLMKKDSAERPPIAEYLQARLEAAGVRVLQNEAAGIEAPSGGSPLYVAGIGSVWAENSDPAAALAGVPAGAARLVLMHNPESFREIAAGEAPLAFGAHTHGGQIRVIPGAASSWLDIVRKGEVVADGWAADSIGAARNRLYVNRGIGFSTVPIRINCRPELTLATLRRARGAYDPSGPAATTDG